MDKIADAGNFFLNNFEKNKKRFLNYIDSKFPSDKNMHSDLPDENTDHDLSANEIPERTSVIDIVLDDDSNEIIRNDEIERSIEDSNKDDTERLSEHEIAQMFLTCEDKYSLISELFDKGYTAGIITRCSGIPIGEVKLVLDLNDSN